MTAQVIPAGVRLPADHKPAAVVDEPGDDVYRFDWAGREFASRPFRKVLTPGFMRRNRHLDQMDFSFTFLEAIFDGDDAALAAFDEMTWEQFNAHSEAVGEVMQRAVQASLGESSASST